MERLIVKPEHEFYQGIMAGVTHLEQPVHSIPDFIDDFWTSREQKEHRIWLLTLISDGIKRRDDLSSVYYYFALDAILHAMVNCDRNYYMRYIYLFIIIC